MCFSHTLFLCPYANAPFFSTNCDVGFVITYKQGGEGVHRVLEMLGEAPDTYGYVLSGVLRYAVPVLVFLLQDRTLYIQYL